MKRFVITLALMLMAASAIFAETGPVVNLAASQSVVAKSATTQSPLFEVGPTIPPNPWESRLLAHPKPVALTSPVVKGKCPDDYPEGTGGVPCCGCRSARASASK